MFGGSPRSNVSAIDIFFLLKSPGLLIVEKRKKGYQVPVLQYVYWYCTYTMSTTHLVPVRSRLRLHYSIILYDTLELCNRHWLLALFALLVAVLPLS
jgi:hypothetical protein